MGMDVTSNATNRPDAISPVLCGSYFFGDFMTKRQDIDQLKHDYFMLSKRVELLEKRVAELLTVDAKSRDTVPFNVPDHTWPYKVTCQSPTDHFKPLSGKTLEDVQKAWHARHSSVLHGQNAPKINDLTSTKCHWIPTPADVAPKPYAHPNCED
jgi:hypothetical protein